MSWKLTGGALFPAPPLTSSETSASAPSCLDSFSSLVIRPLPLILPFVLPSAHVKALCNLDSLARVGDTLSFLLASADVGASLTRESQIL